MVETVETLSTGKSKAKTTSEADTANRMRVFLAGLKRQRKRQSCFAHLAESTAYPQETLHMSLDDLLAPPNPDKPSTTSIRQNAREPKQAPRQAAIPATLKDFMVNDAVDILETSTDTAHDDLAKQQGMNTAVRRRIFSLLLESTVCLALRLAGLP